MSELLKKRARDNIGAMGIEDIPTRVSQLINDLGFLTTADNLIQSVNGQVGIVNLATGHIPETTNLYFTDQRVTDSPQVVFNTLAVTDGRFELVINKGVAGGYAPLDSSGWVFSNNLPDEVKNFEEYADFASLPATGRVKTFYVTLDDGAVYRWNGSSYLVVSGTITAGAIKTLYESNPDTNAFTDNYKADLDYITVTQNINLDDIALNVTTNASNISANFVAIQNIVSFVDAPSDGTPYNRQDGAWIAAGSGGGNGTFAGLTDTDISSPTNGQVPIFNSSTGNWENGTNPAGVTDHTLLSNIGTNTHAQIDAHIADTDIHYTMASIVITKSQVSDFGTYNNYIHPTGDGNLHVPANGSGNANRVLTASGTPGVYTWEVPSTGITDHTALSNIGTNTHAQIDSHIADSSVHFTMAAISITESQISDLQSYLTSETSHADVLVDGDFASAGIMATDGAGVYSIITDNSSNWNTAFGWGDHAGLYSLTSHTHSSFDRATSALSGANVFSDIVVADGIVTGVSSRVLTLSDLGYTGSPTANNYTHPVGDGNLHVPANGTTNENKVLTASAVAGVYTWETPDTVITNHTLLSNIGVNSHAQIDAHIADTDIHYTMGSISITESQISDLQNYSLASHTHSLANLTDVVSAATTNRFVLAANGSGYVGRALVAADISDLPTYGSGDFVDLTTAQSVGGIKTFTSDLYVGNQSGTHLRLIPTLGVMDSVSSTGDWASIRPTQFILHDGGNSRSIFIEAPGTISNNYSQTLQNKAGTFAYMDDIVTYDNTDFVDLTSAQTVAGIKTFSSFGITPSTAPTTDYQWANKKYVDDSIIAAGGYTNEEAQDAIGTILVDSSEIDFTYNDATPSITASLIAASISESKLNASINASLDLADSSLQPGDIGTTVQPYNASNTAQGIITLASLGGTTDHTALSNIGTNTHAQIDTHISDTDIHFTQASISITESQISDLQNYSLSGHTHTLGSLTNVSLTSVTVGELLRWNGSLWVNATLAEAGVSSTSHNHTLDSLSNLVITSNSNGEILKWNGTNWVNNTLAEAGIAAASHNHSGVYEPVFTKNTGFNKNFGTTSGTVAQGNDSRINNGQTAFGWGDHAAAGYLTVETDSQTLTWTAGTKTLAISGGNSQVLSNLIDVSGTPVANQIGIWDGSGTLKGSSDFTYDSAAATLSLLDPTAGVDVISRLGKNSTDNLTIQSNVNASSTQLVDVNISTLSSSTAANAGEIRYNIDGLTDRLRIHDTGVTSPSFIRTGGTSSQFLKADGSVDTTTYAVDSDVLHKSQVEDISGNKRLLDNVALTFGTGNDVAFKSTGSTLDAEFATGAQIKFMKGITLLHRFTDTGNFDALGDVTGNSFTKHGGTSSQFLKANGSVDSTSYLPSSSYTAADVLAKLLTVDGPSSGLNADLLDGLNSSVFVRNDGSSGTRFDGTYLQFGGDGGSNNDYISYNDSTNRFYFNADATRSTTTANASIQVGSVIVTGGSSSQFLKADGSLDSTSYLASSSYTAADVLAKILTVDGPGSGLNADLLDGYGTSDGYTGTNIPLRNSSGDIRARLFRSNYAEQTGAPGTTADIAFRNSTSDDYIRFMTNSAFSTWCQNASIKTHDSAELGGVVAANYARTDIAETFSSTITATNFILSSDERLKENIEDVDYYAFIKVDWKTFNLKKEPEQKRYGVVAQELEKDHPEFVRTDEAGEKSVAYIDLLIAKIAELEARLEKAGL